MAWKEPPRDSQSSLRRGNTWRSSALRSATMSLNVELMKTRNTRVSRTSYSSPGAAGTAPDIMARLLGEKVACQSTADHLRIAAESPAERGIGVLDPIQSMQDDRAGIPVSGRVTIEFGLQEVTEALVVTQGRARDVRRWHDAGAQLADDLLPQLSISADSTEVSAFE